MIFIDKMKYLKIYKTPMFLPTLEDNKKKGSAVLLLTPDYNSSKRLMNNPLFINRLRFESYYMEKNVAYYINDKNIKEVNEAAFFTNDKGEKVPKTCPKCGAEVKVFLRGEPVYLCSNKECNKYFGTVPFPTKESDIINEGYSSVIDDPAGVEEHPMMKLSGFMGDDKRWNPLVELKGFNGMKFRGRSEVLIYNKKDNTVFLVFDKDGEYRIPGGAWGENEAQVLAAEREAKEEAKIQIKHPTFCQSYITFYDKIGDGIKNLPTKHQWIGEYNYLYCAEYGEEYIGGIEKVDKDDDMKENGKFYPVKEVYNKLSICHQYALSACMYQGLADEPNSTAAWQGGRTSDIYIKTDILGEAIITPSFLNSKAKELGYDTDNKLDRLPPEAVPVFYERLKKLLAQNDELATVEENYSTDRFLSNISESSVINTGDKIIFMDESSANDTQLKNILYNNRIRKRAEVLEIYDKVKVDSPWIKYTFPMISKYQNRNIFVDLNYYNKIFFENNHWVLNKGLNLYYDFMNRLINNPILNDYKKKTIFIPVTDWDKTNMIWNYRQSLSPISLIYQLLYTDQLSRLQSMFGNSDIIFVGGDRYFFKMNFSLMNIQDPKKVATTLRMFLIKMVKNEDFSEEDIDSTSDNNVSSDVIKANIVDKIEQSKGIDLTANVAIANKIKNSKSESIENKKNLSTQKTIEKSSDKVISKGTLNQVESEDKKKLQANINKLAVAIDTVGDNSNSEDDAWDSLDTDDIKQILIDLGQSDENTPDISISRSSRMTELEKQILDSEIKGKSIKDLLDESQNKELKVTQLDISTPNEEWKNISFINFDKNYNIDAVIARCFIHFNKDGISRPIAIRNMKVEDNSTSEDRVELYTVEMEDYRGKRFTVKLDIPIMVDNRFLLRGYYKSIQTQYFNMPIIKTDDDTCQIISNYMKIFVRRFGSGVGKSLPATGRFLKAINKYTGRKIKIELGDNTKVCAKYHLPIDYIDISKSINKIETDEFIVYFNQDEIRSIYIDKIKEGNGIPYLFSKKNDEIYYYENNNRRNFISVLLEWFKEDKYADFIELFYNSTPSTVSAYSRCKVMNSQIPLIVICSYHEGLRKVLDKAHVEYKICSTLPKEERRDEANDWIKFNDGYVLFRSTYESSLLLNGLKICPTEEFSIADIDNRNMYLEFLNNFGGRIKADGLDNFYDLMIDPMIEDTLKFYKLPTDYVSVLLYANALLADNKFIKHTDASSRKMRRYELIAVYTYKVLAEAYALYANQLRHSRQSAEFSVKQSAVIDRFLTDTITSDDSCINALRDVETTNAVTTKGPSGMNTDRAYSLDKRTYDESMINILGISTGFAGNVGITRQSTIDANVDENGYVLPIGGDTEQMNSAKTLTITEALTPFGSTRDDPFRTAMTFVQTAKHMVRTEESDPLLVTNGSDEALAYLTTDKFAFKAKKNGKVLELTDEYILVEYEDGTKDYINLTETIEKNSDGGYFVPLKLTAMKKLKVGSKIKENDILAYDEYSFSNSVGESNNLAYNIGKLAKVAVINTDEGFEDSGIITESMAKKLATRINIKFDATLDKDTNVLSMLKIGDKVECEDTLMSWQSPFNDEDANSLMKTLGNEEDISELGKRRLKSKVTGVVKGIKIFRTVEIEDLSDSLKKIVTDYEKPLIELEKKYKENGLDISQIPAHYILPPTGRLKKAQNSVVIEYYVEYLDTVGIGDKVVYFSANKAVEKNIIPAGKEPYTAFRPNEPVDAFVSEVSIDKRMVTSTIVYGSLQKLMIELDRSVKDIMGIPYDDTTV